MTPVLMDWETTSGCDLRATGGRTYALHPSTRILCLVMRADGFNYSWVPASTCKMPEAPNLWNHDDVPEFMVYLAQTHGLCAHNAENFDRHIWDRFVGVEVPWTDSIHRARCAGFPASLDQWCKRLGLPGKDEAGAKILDSCMRLKWNGKKWHNPMIGAGSVSKILAYCIQDVEQMEKALSLTPPIHPVEVPGILTHQRINNRGIGFDESLAAAISRISADVVEDSKQRIETLTHGALRASVKGKKNGDLASPAVLYPWLESQGVKLSNLRRSTVDSWIASPVTCEYAPEGATPLVIDVLRLRQCALRITGAKLERASAACLNGRLQDLYIYHGAHTGRATSRLVQVHNLPRGVNGLNLKELCDNPTRELVFSEAERLGVLPDDVMSAMIRPCFIPSQGNSFSVSDFNAVEPRIIAWLSDQENLLEAFRASRDPYLELASILYGRPCTKADKTERQVAKVVLLGSQYQLGPGTLATYASSQGVDLSAAGVTPEQCIETYRSLYPRIAGYPTGTWNGRTVRKHGLWGRLQEAWKLACTERETTEVGKLLFEYAENSVRVTLPSGRYIYYRNPRIEPRLPPWDGDPIPTCLFDGVRGETSTYGGKLAENVTQAIGYDLLAEALVLSDHENLYPVIHSHDEIACETNRLGTLIQLMELTPAWAEGLPIKAEGFVTSRYAKSPI